MKVSRWAAGQLRAKFGEAETVRATCSAQMSAHVNRSAIATGNGGWLGKGKRTHRSFPDPALTNNMDDFRKVRDDVARKIPQLLMQVG